MLYSLIIYPLFPLFTNIFPHHSSLFYTSPVLVSYAFLFSSFSCFLFFFLVLFFSLFSYFSFFPCFLCFPLFYTSPMLVSYACFYAHFLSPIPAFLLLPPSHIPLSYCLLCFSRSLSFLTAFLLPHSLMLCSLPSGYIFYFLPTLSNAISCSCSSVFHFLFFTTIPFPHSLIFSTFPMLMFCHPFLPSSFPRTPFLICRV